MPRYRTVPCRPPKVTRKNYPGATEIFDAGFDTRVRNCLILDGIFTLERAGEVSAQDLFDIRNFGYKSLLLFARRMRELGRTVHPQVFDWLTHMEKEGH